MNDKLVEFSDDCSQCDLFYTLLSSDTEANLEREKIIYWIVTEYYVKSEKKNTEDASSDKLQQTKAFELTSVGVELHAKNKTEYQCIVKCSVARKQFEGENTLD